MMMKSVLPVLLLIATYTHANASDITYQCKVTTVEEIPARILYVKAPRDSKLDFSQGGSLIPNYYIMEDEVNVSHEELVKISRPSKYTNRNGRADEAYDYYELSYKTSDKREALFSINDICQASNYEQYCRFETINADGHKRENVFSYKSLVENKRINVEVSAYVEDGLIKFYASTTARTAKPEFGGFGKNEVITRASTHFKAGHMPSFFTIGSLSTVTKSVEALAYTNDRSEAIETQIECSTNDL